MEEAMSEHKAITDRDAAGHHGERRAEHEPHRHALVPGDIIQVDPGYFHLVESNPITGGLNKVGELWVTGTYPNTTERWALYTSYIKPARSGVSGGMTMVVVQFANVSTGEPTSIADFQSRQPAGTQYIQASCVSGLS
jgi:hypothetical protein